METIVKLPLSQGQSFVQLPKGRLWELKVAADIERSRTKQTILETVHMLGQATIEQIVRLNWSAGYKRDIQRHASQMVRDEILEVDIPPKYTRFGSSPHVYLTGRNSGKYLKALGYEVKRYRGLREKRRADPHSLAVNDFLINTLLLEKQNTGVFVRTFETEEQVNANPLRVPVPKTDGTWETKSLASDLFVVLETEYPARKHGLLPEIYTSKIDLKRWRDKVRAYLYCFEAYKARFGTEYLTAIPVLVATRQHFPRVQLSTLTEKERMDRQLEERRRQKRLLDMLRATELEIDQLGAHAEADLFLFSAAPLDELTPEEQHYSPLWYAPFQKHPEPLLLRDEEE
jgi:hypothetical protein